MSLGKHHIPTAEGAWVDPNQVPRGTTKVTLRNLTPGTVYQITIWTIFDSTTLRGQSKKSFQTPANILVPKDVQPEALSTAGLAVAVTCLVIIIILIVLIVIIFRRIDRLATHNGKSSDFRTWLLSKQISEDTYEVLQREGFQDPAIFAFLKPEAVSRLAIRPMAQELILTDIVESFNKGETPFQTCGTAGDELYDDVTNEKYEHLRVA